MDDEEQFYKEQLMDNYKNPQNVGKLDDYTFFRYEKNALCGDEFTIYVKVDRGKISDVKFEGEGCALSTASFSLLSSKLIGMDFKDAKSLTEKDIFDLVGIKISPNRVNCALLSLNAFSKGAFDYEN